MYGALTHLRTLGALQTPQLLELSGIGDKRILDAPGIDTVIDLPGVGENLRTYPRRMHEPCLRSVAC
jgi:choline dehydrogenase-like flavoprotein